jgi:hypothetical protein
MPGGRGRKGYQEGHVEEHGSIKQMKKRKYKKKV